MQKYILMVARITFLATIFSSCAGSGGRMSTYMSHGSIGLKKAELEERKLEGVIELEITRLENELDSYKEETVTEASDAVREKKQRIEQGLRELSAIWDREIDKYGAEKNSKHYTEFYKAVGRDLGLSKIRNDILRGDTESLRTALDHARAVEGISPSVANWITSRNADRGNGVNPRKTIPNYYFEPWQLAEIGSLEFPWVIHDLLEKRKDLSARTRLLNQRAEQVLANQIFASARKDDHLEKQTSMLQDYPVLESASAVKGVGAFTLNEDINENYKRAGLIGSCSVDIGQLGREIDKDPLLSALMGSLKEHSVDLFSAESFKKRCACGEYDVVNSIDSPDSRQLFDAWAEHEGQTDFEKNVARGMATNPDDNDPCGCRYSDIQKYVAK